MRSGASNDERVGPGGTTDADVRVERELAADDRERAANQRDSAADARESVADARETLANERDRQADAREQKLASWEERLNRRDHAFGRAAVASPDQGREAVARARALVAASVERLDRSEATLRRVEESAAREQRTVDREVAASAMAWARSRDDPSTASALAMTAARLRTRLIATALELAEVVDLSAAQHERLVREDSDNADEHQRRAGDARAGAELARAIARQIAV